MAFISKKIEDLMNYRIQQEELSSRIYRAMAVYLDFMGYTGSAKLYYKYADEEMVHAKKAYEYLLDLDLLPNVPPLDSPDQNFTSLPDIIKKAYDHEMDVTNQCNDLAKAALAENDFMTTQLAQWYLTEQTEEISKSSLLMNRVDSFVQTENGEYNKTDLQELDEYLGELAEGD
jgi:ferritin